MPFDFQLFFELVFWWVIAPVDVVVLLLTWIFRRREYSYVCALLYFLLGGFTALAEAITVDPSLMVLGFFRWGLSIVFCALDMKHASFKST